MSLLRMLRAKSPGFSRHDRRGKLEYWRLIPRQQMRVASQGEGGRVVAEGAA